MLISTVVDPDPHHFVKPDKDPGLNTDPEPDPHQRQTQDLDPHQVNFDADPQHCRSGSETPSLS
jgi:hypothetical protein